jgi:hypothetical protein
VVRWIRIAGALAFVVSCGACTDHEPDADPRPPGWQTVTFDGVSFDVPAAWPVQTSEDWFEFQCSSASEDGVFLPPAEHAGGANCPVTHEYGASVHVVPYDGERVEGAGAVEEGTGADHRVVRSTPANRWHSVFFTERGIQLVFYEIDDETYDAIVASVEGTRA